MSYLHQKWANDKDLSDKIMNKLEERGIDKNIDGLSDCDSTNLFDAHIFKIFQNIKTIILITTHWNGIRYYQYVFSFIYLLSVICESSTLTNIEIKAIRNKYDEPSWLYCLWSCSSSYLIEKYKQKNLNIALKTNTIQIGGLEYLEDTILICKY